MRCEQRSSIGSSFG